MVDTHRSGDYTLMKDIRVTHIDLLKPNDWNPNEMTDEMLESVKYGIRKEGFLTPILAQASTNKIIDGEHRYQAAKSLGLKEVLVQYIDVSDLQAKKLTLAMNNRRGHNEAAKLDSLLSDIKSMDDDLKGIELGFSEDYFNQLVEASTDWLDDLADTDIDKDTSLDEEDASEEVAKKAKSEFSRLNFVVTPKQRDVIINKLNKIKKEYNFTQSSDALVKLCEEGEEDEAE